MSPTYILTLVMNLYHKIAKIQDANAHQNNKNPPKRRVFVCLGNVADATPRGLLHIQKVTQ